MNDAPPNAKIYKASRLLQSKVGKMLVKPEQIAKSQKVIDNNDFDFTSLGLDILRKLEDAVVHAQDDGIPMIERKQAITVPVMELKANARTFKYNLIGDLANIMLHFLETTTSLDKDAIQIVDAHQKTLRAIIVKRMTGNGGDYGEILLRELTDVCNRYTTRKK